MKEKIIHSLQYPKDVDRMIVPMLNVLNSIPGIRTLYSCDGHGCEQFYVAMAVCSEESALNVAEWAKRNIDDVEVDASFGKYRSRFGYSIDGILPFEESLGIYSNKIGELKYGKRRRTISRLAESLMDFVPYNLW